MYGKRGSNEKEKSFLLTTSLVFRSYCFECSFLKSKQYLVFFIQHFKLNLKILVCRERFCASENSQKTHFCL